VSKTKKKREEKTSPLDLGQGREVLVFHERESSMAGRENLMMLIYRCNFKDMGYCGPDFTWCNFLINTNELHNTMSFIK